MHFMMKSSHWASAAVLLTAVLLLAACDGGATGGDASSGMGGSENTGGSQNVGELVTPLIEKIAHRSVDKVDLLLMIDNSLSTGDKHEILSLAVPDLVQQLTDPACLSAGGERQLARGDVCPSGFAREFQPIEDINVAIISSSLGDVGANAVCPPESADRYPPGRADMAHTVGSLDRGQVVASNEHGFLEWRPGVDGERFIRDFQDMIRVVGDQGCGWEASLESWYRFLVDPFPYQELVRTSCTPGGMDSSCVSPATQEDGQVIVDEVLLEQRSAFLRDDSLLAVLMLSDENDCSVRVGGSSWQVIDTSDSGSMFRGTSACEENPNDRCCYSCAGQPPEGCSFDPVCDEPRLSASEDGLNVRCYEQKRRFGIDFLYPTERYVNALREAQICWTSPSLALDDCPEEDIVTNPLYAGGRSPSTVFLGGIVGVPWQEIAASVDADGDPLSFDTLRFKSWNELTSAGDWGYILGDPGTPYTPATESTPEQPGTPPVSPRVTYMVESELERPGIATANPVNGRDRNTARTAGAPGDLQYACIFPLSSPRECDDPNVLCECNPGQNDSPLCEEEPGVSEFGTTQYWAGAYPGLRQLQVLKEHGEAHRNSMVASVCARNVDIPTQPDFGYRPAMLALVEAVKPRLGSPCLSRVFPVEEDGTLSCSLVEARAQLDPGEPCECRRAEGRVAPQSELDAQVRTALSEDLTTPCGADDPQCQNACLCRVLQANEANEAGAAALDSCQNDSQATGLEGWCYLEDTGGRPVVGSPELLDDCPWDERHRLRFPGQSLRNDSLAFMVCEP